MTRLPALAWILMLSLLAVGSSARAGERGEGEEFRRPSVLRVGPFEKTLGYPARLTISGKVEPGYRFSEALLVRPDGSAIVVPGVKRVGDMFRVPLRLAQGKGIYRLELTATTDRDRTHSGARILLYVGVPENHPDEPPPEDVRPDKRLPAAVLAVDLFRRVNALRKRLRLRELDWLEPLAQAAREHAAACVKRGKLDHTFPGVGTIAARVRDEFGFERVIYRRPRSPPTEEKGAKSYVATLLEARRGLEPVLHRWKRFAAFCVPMTSPLMTHAACGIAKTKRGSLYIVFAFAQINGQQIKERTDALYSAALREVTSGITLDEERPARLRELGLWLRRGARKRAKAYARSKTPAIRAAALDVLLLFDPAGTRKAIEKQLESARGPGSRYLGLLHAALAMRYAPDLLDRATAVASARREAAQAALAHARALAKSEGEAAARAALKRVGTDWPGTPAAEEAEEGL